MCETINPASGIKNVIDINDQIKDKVLLITGGTGPSRLQGKRSI